MHWINRYACLLGGGEGQGKGQAQPGCSTLLRVRRRRSSGAHLEWWVVWDAEARVDSLEPEAQIPCPTWRASARDGHGSNFLCHQGAWPMYGRWSDSDSSLIKGRHFKQWNRPKPPVAFNGFNASRFLGIAGQPVGMLERDSRIGKFLRRQQGYLKDFPLARYFKQALTF